MVLSAVQPANDAKSIVETKTAGIGDKRKGRACGDSIFILKLLVSFKLPRRKSPTYFFVSLTHAVAECRESMAYSNNVSMPDFRALYNQHVSFGAPTRKRLVQNSNDVFMFSG